MFAARHTLLFILICVLLSSCSAIRKSREEYAAKDHSHNTHISSDVRVLPKYEKAIGKNIKKQSAPLYNFIDNWMGVPYCYGGNSHKCTDCSGFVCNLYKDVYKIDLPHSAETQYEKAHHVKKRRLKEGQLVFFNTDKGKDISHVGVYLGNNKFIHASSSKGVRIDDLDEEYYRKAYRAAGKIN